MRKNEKWHIRDDGKVDKCQAENDRCPFGSLSEHFTDKNKAQEYADLTNEIEQMTENTPLKNASLFNLSRKKPFNNENINENTIVINDTRYLEFINKEKTKACVRLAYNDDEEKYIDVPKGLYEKLKRVEEMKSENFISHTPDNQVVNNVFKGVMKENNQPHFINPKGDTFYNIKNIPYGQPNVSSWMHFSTNIQEDEEMPFVKYFNENCGNGKSFDEYRKEMESNGYKMRFYTQAEKDNIDFGVIISKKE